MHSQSMDSRAVNVKTARMQCTPDRWILALYRFRMCTTMLSKAMDTRAVDAKMRTNMHSKSMDSGSVKVQNAP